MSSDAPPKSPTASNNKDVPPNDSPPKYVPQFSAATEMILKRIQSGNSNIIGATPTLSSIGITGTPPGYEDMRRNVLMGMKTTMNMSLPSTPIHYKSRSTRLAQESAGSGAAGSASGKGAPIAPRPSTTPKSRGSADGGSASGGRKQKGGAKGKGAKASAKRKRAKSESVSSEESDNMSKLGGDSDSDDAESVTEFPKVTQSGRQVVKPATYAPPAQTTAKRRAPSKRTSEQALCKRCGRGHSPQSNQVVFCDGCNLPWHQMCHDPPIPEEMVKDETAQWFCLDCSRKKGNKSAGSEPKSTSWQGRSSEEVYRNALESSSLPLI
jgi:hypothetical protein